MKRELEAKLCWSRHSPATLYLETLKRSQATYTDIELHWSEGCWEMFSVTFSYCNSTMTMINLHWGETNVCCSVGPGGGTETWRQRHSCDDSKPHRLHPFGGRLQAEQTDQASLPGLQAGAGQRGQPGVAAHVWPAGAAGTLVQHMPYQAATSIQYTHKDKTSLPLTGADIRSPCANLSGWPQKVHKLLR